LREPIKAPQNPQEEEGGNKMARVPLYMNNVNGWEKVNRSVSANPDDLGHLLDHMRTWE
jgi:hypothetical protein